MARLALRSASSTTSLLSLRFREASACWRWAASSAWREVTGTLPGSCPAAGWSGPCTEAASMLIWPGCGASWASGVRLMQALLSWEAVAVLCLVGCCMGCSSTGACPACCTSPACLSAALCGSRSRLAWAAEAGCCACSMCAWSAAGGAACGSWAEAGRSWTRLPRTVPLAALSSIWATVSTGACSDASW